MELYIKTTRVLFIFKKVQIANLTSGFFLNTLLRVSISEILHNVKHLKNTKYGTLRIHSILHSHFWNAVISATSSCHCRRVKIKNYPSYTYRIKDCILPLTSQYAQTGSTAPQRDLGGRTCPCQALGQEAHPGAGLPSERGSPQSRGISTYLYAKSHFLLKHLRVW